MPQHATYCLCPLLLDKSTMNLLTVLANQCENSVFRAIPGPKDCISQDAGRQHSSPQVVQKGQLRKVAMVKGTTSSGEIPRQQRSAVALLPWALGKGTRGGSSLNRGQWKLEGGGVATCRNCPHKGSSRENTRPKIPTCPPPPTLLISC